MGAHRERQHEDPPEQATAPAPPSPALPASRFSPDGEPHRRDRPAALRRQCRGCRADRPARASRGPGEPRVAGGRLGAGQRLAQPAGAEPGSNGDLLDAMGSGPVTGEGTPADLAGGLPGVSDDATRTTDMNVAPGSSGAAAYDGEHAGTNGAGGQPTRGPATPTSMRHRSGRHDRLRGPD